MSEPGGAGGRVLQVLAWMAVGAFAAVAILGLVPIRNPGVQDCGVPAMFLARGRADVYPDADGRIRNPEGRVQTLDAAEHARALHHRCSQRVAARMVPAGILAVAATLVGTALLIVVWVRAWRRSGPSHGLVASTRLARWTPQTRASRPTCRRQTLRACPPAERPSRRRRTTRRSGGPPRVRAGESFGPPSAPLRLLGRMRISRTDATGRRDPDDVWADRPARRVHAICIGQSGRP